MTNQASEDELRAVVSDILANLMIKSSLQKLDKHTDLMTSGRKYIAMHNEELSTILHLIRTEKLKLLAELREQTTIFKIKAHDKKGQPHLYEAGRGVPTDALAKLEAEL